MRRNPAPNIRRRPVRRGGGLEDRSQPRRSSSRHSGLAEMVRGEKEENLVIPIIDTWPRGNSRGKHQIKRLSAICPSRNGDFNVKDKSAEEKGRCQGEQTWRLARSQGSSGDGQSDCSPRPSPPFLSRSGTEPQTPPKVHVARGSRGTTFQEKS